MSIKTGFAPVAAGQKVAANQKGEEVKKAFTVVWNRTSATIGQTIGITGTANIVVKNASLLSIGILFNGTPFATADNVVVNNGQITAQWKVKPFKAGAFTEGVYDAEIRYNGSLPGKTGAPLKIIAAVQDGDFFG